jgi:hypothetical protein
MKETQGIGIAAAIILLAVYGGLYEQIKNMSVPFGAQLILFVLVCLIAYSVAGGKV